MSETAAVAADTASDAPNCGALTDSGVFSLGNSTSTSPTQNAKRSRKNISRLRPPLAIVLQLILQLSLTAVDKSQVFALRLNLRKFAKNSNDLIRCKFSIDAGRGEDVAGPAGSTISNADRITG